jgi:2-methylisocitrate lyase-like PEP mutase family enzyme
MTQTEMPMMTAAERRKHLKSLIDTGQTLIVPGAFDAISAKLIEQAKFPAVYVGSFATAASRLGQPDVGLTTLDDLVSHARSVVDAVSMPVIADAEGGLNRAANMWRTIEAFEQAGVSAIHIEDHIAGKHTKYPRQLRSIKDMSNIIKATVEARTDPNFLIIARTDIAWVNDDPALAVERLNAFSIAGADLVFPAGFAPKQLKAVRDQINGRVVMTNWKEASVKDEEEAGLSIVIYYGFCLYAAYHGMEKALKEFNKKGNWNKMAEITGSIEPFDELISADDFEKRAGKYGLE